MSAKERVRLEVLSRVKRGEIALTRAAEVAGVSLRQMRRLWKRYRTCGDAGLVHRSRGKPANIRLADAQRMAVLEAYRARYGDFGPTFACEKLAEEGHVLSPDTLTRLLKDAGLWQPRRRRDRHRARRPRRASFGELVQMDGSDHDWFEGRGERCVLMVAIDDATNRTLARFYRRETLEAAFDLFGRWASCYGLPIALYVDRAGIYRPDREASGAELLSGERPVTQFGRAMAQLGVELILANSPQAKGRVERRNAVFQDRLVKELRLAGIGDIERANALLDAWFLPQLNARYTCPAADPLDAHRPAPVPAVLGDILCEHEPRAVGRDWCVRWKNRWLQIDPAHAALALPRKQVLIKSRRDGTLVLEYQGVALTWREIEARPAPARKPRPPVANNKKWTPPESHPWKRHRPTALAGRG